MRKDNLEKNLEKSDYTVDLYKQYKKHLGVMRYKLLLEAQILVVPQQVNKLLNPGKFSLIKLTLILYKLFCKIKIDWFIKSILLPNKYRNEIKALNTNPQNL